MAKVLGNAGSVTTASSSGNWASGVVVGSVEEWSGDYDAGEKDVTTFGSAGFYEALNGNQKLSGSLKMIADDTTPLALFGTGSPTINLFLHSTDRKYSGSAKIRNMKIGPVSGKTADPIIVTFDFVMTGTFTVA